MHERGTGAMVRHLQHLTRRAWARQVAALALGPTATLRGRPLQDDLPGPPRRVVPLEGTLDDPARVFVFLRPAGV